MQLKVLGSVLNLLSMAGCVSPAVSKCESSWGSANSFYYPSVVGGEKAIRQLEIVFHSLKLLVPNCMCLPLIKPPATCLSCQWLHWLANWVETTPPPCMWPVPVKKNYVVEVPFSIHSLSRTDEQMHKNTHLPLYPLQYPRVFPPSFSRAATQDASVHLQHTPIVAASIPFISSLQRTRWLLWFKWKIICLDRYQRMCSLFITRCWISIKSQAFYFKRQFLSFLSPSHVSTQTSFMWQVYCIKEKPQIQTSAFLSHFINAAVGRNKCCHLITSDHK